MPFRPLIDAALLPVPGAAIERTVMDWKTVPAHTSFERAKDITAFANHVGGTLLVGAQERNNLLASYPGIPTAAAASIAPQYSQSVRDLCQPLPRIEAELFDLPGGDGTRKLVAINVWPALNLIGVKVAPHPNPGGYGGESWVYPVRSGLDADYLQPSELAMYLTPQVRRIAVLLSNIAPNEEIEIKYFVGKGHHSYFAQMVEIVEERNILVVRRPSGDMPIDRLPLDRIITVYEDDGNSRGKLMWRVVLERER